MDFIRWLWEILVRIARLFGFGRTNDERKGRKPPDEKENLEKKVLRLLDEGIATAGAIHKALGEKFKAEMAAFGTHMAVYGGELVFFYVLGIGASAAAGLAWKAGGKAIGWISRSKFGRFFGGALKKVKSLFRKAPKNKPLGRGSGRRPPPPAPKRVGNPFNPSTAKPGQRIKNVDPHSLKPGRRDLRKSKMDSLLKADDPVNVANANDPIKVTTDGKIWDGHHRVRIAAERGEPVEIVIVDKKIGGDFGDSILDLPIGDY